MVVGMQWGCVVVGMHLSFKLSGAVGMQWSRGSRDAVAVCVQWQPGDTFALPRVLFVELFGLSNLCLRNFMRQIRDTC